MLVAERLRTATTAPIARLRADEFGVLLGGADHAAAVNELRMLLAVFVRPFEVGGASAEVGASAGIAWVGERTTSLAEAVRWATLAVARAKALGGNRVERYEEHARRELVERTALEVDLRKALATDDDALWCAFQPIVSLADRKIVGTEALARWNHPEHGAIPPQRFIAIAEEMGLVGVLGERILGIACRQVAAWRAAGGPDAPLGVVSVNLATRQLADPGLVPRVRAALRRSGAPGEALVLEVTETSLLDDAPVVIGNMHGLARLGVRLVLDDFGTGFSSLDYLSRLPVTGIKVDRSFVARIGEDRPVAGDRRGDGLDGFGAGDDGRRRGRGDPGAGDDPARDGMPDGAGLPVRPADARQPVGRESTVAVSP